MFPFVETWETAPVFPSCCYVRLFLEIDPLSPFTPSFFKDKKKRNIYYSSSYSMIYTPMRLHARQRTCTSALDPIPAPTRLVVDPRTLCTFSMFFCFPQVQKKRRIAGRTLCRNIKNECPKPNCDEPVLLPGRCCKVCLEDGAVGKSNLIFFLLAGNLNDYKILSFRYRFHIKTQVRLLIYLAMATKSFYFKKKKKKKLFFWLVVEYRPTHTLTA